MKIVKTLILLDISIGIGMFLFLDTEYYIRDYILYVYGVLGTMGLILVIPKIYKNIKPASNIPLQIQLIEG